MRILGLVGFFFLLCLPKYSLAQNLEADQLKFKEARMLLYDEPEKAISISKKLLVNNKKPDQLANIYMLISTAYIAKRDIDSSLYYIMRTSDLLNTNIQSVTKIRILNTIGVQYQQMDLFDKALESLDKSEELCKTLPAADYDRNFNQNFIDAVRGMIYRSQENPEMAIKKFVPAISFFKSLPTEPKTDANISVFSYNLGYCFLELKNYEQAQSYFNEAIFYGTRSGSKSLEAFAYKALADNYYSQQDYKKSLEILATAQKLSDDVSDLSLKEGVYKITRDNYLALNDWKNYQSYNDLLKASKQKKQDSELKSLNRLMDIQNKDYQKKVDHENQRFSLFQIIVWLVVLLCSVLMLKKIFDFSKQNKNLTQKLGKEVNS
ncbi:tetratricopeptide repeat protein [Soonwooa sp.]|uniref:tetratricopeptide repeat protein n=1 Tax=Soonwooa sp. TaxID=1938592 RepID=UPI002624AF56|nr:tetratricopeptide repeat protein [Soonwooa sp.]